MKIDDWESADTLPKLYRELQELGLELNVAELEAFGYTIVPPELVGPPDLHSAVRAALLAVGGRRSGETPDVKGGTTHTDQRHALGQVARFILWDDPVFERLVLNPAALGLVQYLVGTNCILSLFDGALKGPGGNCTPIHADWADFNLKAFPHEPNTANFNYLASDYSKEDGALSFVPGSHRWRRLPSPEEVVSWADRAVPVEAPAGSMVVWGDHTWHGSYPRTVAGLRLTVIATYCKPTLQTQEPFRTTCTQEALDRNPRRFAALMDQYGWFPFGVDDLDGSRVKENPTGLSLAARQYCSLFDDEPAAGAVTLRPNYDYRPDAVR
jgi:ectoine hydroxylase-related dioxygenase (phytanoyl-CoA dioxygenase family)